MTRHNPWSQASAGFLEHKGLQIYRFVGAGEAAGPGQHVRTTGKVTVQVSVWSSSANRP